jgi:hypothetical protein
MFRKTLRLFPKQSTLAAKSSFRNMTRSIQMQGWDTISLYSKDSNGWPTLNSLPRVALSPLKRPFSMYSIPWNGILPNQTNSRRRYCESIIVPREVKVICRAPFDNFQFRGELRTKNASLLCEAERSWGNLKDSSSSRVFKSCELCCYVSVYICEMEGNWGKSNLGFAKNRWAVRSWWQSWLNLFVLEEWRAGSNAW